jgi:transcriptional regulator with XRE-family HTH domain
MDQAIDQGVGGEIKRLRSERDWSMAKLAVEADMSVSGVSMIENGKRNLTTTTLAKLARAFGVEVADLFPKAEAPLWSAESPDRRPSVLAKAVVAAADIWKREIQDPAASWQKIYEAGEKVLDLQDFISTRLEEPGWWKGLSEQERHDIVYVDKHLDALGTAVYRRHLERKEEDAEQDAQHEEFARRREQIKEMTSHLSA